ncbi:MAG: HopJ type III effector protein [Sedimenticola sp.]
MNLEKLLHLLNASPHTVEFDDVMTVIADNYHYAPTRFSNGLHPDQVINEVGSNEGSCRIFAFAQHNGLNEQQTLDCFGRYYREDVLQHPDGDDHANIRCFMRHGWPGIRFEGTALTPR